MRSLGLFASGALIGLALMMPCRILLAEAQPPRLLFKADFEGTLTPSVGVGAAIGATEKARFADGIRGKGFVADGSAVLAYPAAGNLSKARGTVCMWIRPTWPGSDGQNHGFFSDDLNFDDPPQNNVYLWKWVHSDTLRFDIRTTDLRDITTPVSFWKPGEWHHIAASWDCEQGTQLFADGRLVAACSLKWQPKDGTKFYVGCNWHGGAPAMATIDDLRIYNSPLNEGQVRRVMNNLTIPAIRIVRVQAPSHITSGQAFPVSLSVQSEEAADQLPLSVTVGGLSLPSPQTPAKLGKGQTTLGPFKFVLPRYYRVPEGEHLLEVNLQGVHILNPEATGLRLAVATRPAVKAPIRWQSTRDGRVLRNGEIYLAPGNGVAFWYEGQVHSYDRTAQRLCADLVRSGGIVDVIPCRRIDEVRCTETDHGFEEWGKSEVVTLSDGRPYRLPGHPETVQERQGAYRQNCKMLPAFAYTLKCRPQPTPHLVVVDTLNDTERCLETAIDVAPGSHPSALLGVSGMGATYLVNLHVMYTGREYPTDGKPIQQVSLFFPKSDAIEVTFSDSGRAPQRPAVSRVSVYEITTDLDDLALQTDSRLAMGRTVSLFYPWPDPIYEEYGYSSGTAGCRYGSISCLMQYLRFMGFNRLEFHPYGFSREAFFKSKLFPHFGPIDLFSDTLPVAERYGIEVVPRVDSMTFYFSGKGAEKYKQMQEIFQLTRRGKTMDYFGTVPDPIHPEVQQLLYDMLWEMATQTKGYANVPAIGFRANGKFGTLYVGTDRAHPPEESGYSEFDIKEFEKDTGAKVGGSAGDPQSRYTWLRANAWHQWVEWRCRRIYDHWLRCRDVVTEVDPKKKLIVFTKIPSNDPGEKRDWNKAPVPLLDLHKYHGYDPALFVNDSGISLSRVIGIDADRYWPEKWNKLYFFQPELSSFFRSREASGVELYYIYWELSGHPRGGRVGPGSPYGRAFYEPMTHALRLQNPGHFTFYNWFRATMGHEQDLRQFCRAFRALPLVEPSPFKGSIEPPEAARDERLAVRMFGDRLGVINDSHEARTVRLTLPPGYGQKGVLNLAQNTRCEIEEWDGNRTITLHLRPWDLVTLVPVQ